MPIDGGSLVEKIYQKQIAREYLEDSRMWLNLTNSIDTFDQYGLACQSIVISTIVPIPSKRSKWIHQFFYNNVTYDEMNKMLTSYALKAFYYKAH